MSKLPDNPFRNESASSKIYAVLAKATKPLAVKDIAERAKVSLEKTITLVNAYQNKYHNAPLRKIGAAVVHDKDGFRLSAIKPDKDAQRPPRGKAKSKKSAAKPKKAKAAKKTKPKAKPKPAKKQAAPNLVAAPAPVPAQEPAADASDAAAQAQ